MFFRRARRVVTAHFRWTKRGASKHLNAKLRMGKFKLSRWDAIKALLLPARVKIFEKAMGTPEGRIAIAQAMVTPIRISLAYNGEHLENTEAFNAKETSRWREGTYIDPVSLQIYRHGRPVRMEDSDDSQERRGSEQSGGFEARRPVLVTT